MPSDTYILTISEAGVSVPSTHASTHISGGSDPIPTATASASGLMSAAIYDQHVANTAKVSNVTHTGDVTDTSGVLTVNKINGVALSSLPNNSILKTTTGGIISFASAEDFPTLNQNTAGNAATATYATTAGSATSATTATTATAATAATTATNIAGGSVGSIPYQSASGTTSLLSAGTSGYVLTANGTSSAPSWSPIDLSADIGGILPVGKGGTGAVTLTGYVKGTGTTAMTANATVPVEDISGILPIAKGGTGATSLTTGYVKSNGTTLTSVSTIPATDITGLSSTVDLSDVAGVLSVANGGTGSTDGVFLGTGGSYTADGNVTGVLHYSNGGTGRTTYEEGSVIIGTAVSGLSYTPTAPQGSVLTSGGWPTFRKVALDNATASANEGSGSVAHVAGTLPVANGGTGASTLTGYIKGNGTGAFTASSTIPASDITGLAGSSYGSCKRLSAIGVTTPANTWTLIPALATAATADLSGMSLYTGSTAFGLVNSSGSDKVYAVSAGALLYLISPNVNDILFEMQLAVWDGPPSTTYTAFDASYVRSDKVISTGASSGTVNLNSTRLTTSSIIPVPNSKVLVLLIKCQSLTSIGVQNIYLTAHSIN